jgi:hypothetical protein
MTFLFGLPLRLPLCPDAIRRASPSCHRGRKIQPESREQSATLINYHSVHVNRDHPLATTHALPVVVCFFDKSDLGSRADWSGTARVLRNLADQTHAPRIRDGLSKSDRTIRSSAQPCCCYRRILVTHEPNRSSAKHPAPPLSRKMRRCNHQVWPPGKRNHPLCLEERRANICLSTASLAPYISFAALRFDRKTSNFSRFVTSSRRGHGLRVFLA